MEVDAKIVDRTGQLVEPDEEGLDADVVEVDYTTTRLRKLPQLTHLTIIDVGGYCQLPY